MLRLHFFCERLKNCDYHTKRQIRDLFYRTGLFDGHNKELLDYITDKPYWFL